MIELPVLPFDDHIVLLWLECDMSPAPQAHVFEPLVLRDCNLAGGGVVPGVCLEVLNDTYFLITYCV